MTRRRLIVTPLALETLEDRSLLAGNVFVALTEGMLTILGDEQANGVSITYDVATGRHRVDGFDQGGSATTFNGDLLTPLPLEFTGVKNIHVRLGGGDDRLEFGAVDQVYTRIGSKLAIEMGDGNDEVELGRAGNVPSVGTDVLHRLYVNKGIYVDLGNGDDELKVANLKTNKSLIVLAGNGNDDVIFATEFTPAGATAATLFPVTIDGNLHVHLGHGDDELTILHALVGQHVQVRDPSGSTYIGIADVAIAKSLDIVTGNQVDHVMLDYVRADDLKIQTSASGDDVRINHSRFKRMDVRTGSGEDDLTLRNSRTKQVTYLDGGDGGADYSQGGNILRGLVKRNLT